MGRYRTSPGLRALNPRVWTMLRTEESRMRREHADAWQVGARILAETGIG